MPTNCESNHQMHPIGERENARNTNQEISNAQWRCTRYIGTRKTKLNKDLQRKIKELSFDRITERGRERVDMYDSSSLFI